MIAADDVEGEQGLLPLYGLPCVTLYVLALVGSLIVSRFVTGTAATISLFVFTLLFSLPLTATFLLAFNIALADHNRGLLLTWFGVTLPLLGGLALLLGSEWLGWQLLSLMVLSVLGGVLSRLVWK